FIGCRNRRKGTNHGNEPIRNLARSRRRSVRGWVSVDRGVRLSVLQGGKDSRARRANDAPVPRTVTVKDGVHGKFRPRGRNSVLAAASPSPPLQCRFSVEHFLGAVVGVLLLRESQQIAEHLLVIPAECRRGARDLSRRFAQ